MKTLTDTEIQQIMSYSIIPYRASHEVHLRRTAVALGALANKWEQCRITDARLRDAVKFHVDQLQTMLMEKSL